MKRLLCAIGVVATLCLGGCTWTASPDPSSSSTDSTDEELAARIERFASAFVFAHEKGLNGSLLVARGDDVIISEGFGPADSEQEIPNRPGTRFRIASITKQFTAMAILLEQSLGTLTVDDPICDHLSPCPAAWEPITVRHLLTHTSGIPEIVRLPEFQGTENMPLTPAQTTAMFADEPLDFTPGDRFRYSNSGYILLGTILEKVSGVSYETYLESNIFEPLGMADSGYEHDGDILAVGYLGEGVLAPEIDMAVPYAAGALFSTVEDLHRWDRAIADGRLLPADALTDGAIGAPPSGEGEFTYGFGVFVGESAGHRMIFHGGNIFGFNSFYATYPDDDLCIVILTNREDHNIFPMAGEIERMVLAP